MVGKPRLLDLFCGAGGAAVGYARAGFEVVGVDHVNQPNYPFEFVQGDALEFMRELIDGSYHLPPLAFDVIHASPPCQAFTKAQKLQGNTHPDLIGPTRRLLLETGLPYVIENVPGSPLRSPAVLEGQMFEELRTIRPRWFETNWPLEVPFMRFSRPKQVRMGRRPKDGEWIQVVGHFSDVPAGGRAMGIDWMTQGELAEAIPPAYTEFIGTQLLAYLGVDREAASDVGGRHGG